MPDTIPILSATAAASNIKTTGCKTAGNITSTGGQPILERGFCIGLYSLPTTSNTKIVDPLAEIGSFETTLTELNLNTTYFVRAYAINSIGTGYGTEMTFKTLLTPSLEEVKDLSFGYLNGYDLLRFCQYQMLLKQGSIDIESLTFSVNSAYSEFKSNFGTLYDIEHEFLSRGNDRSLFVANLVSKMAIRILLSNSTQITDYHASIFTHLDEMVKNIRLGQLNLEGLNVAPTSKYSDVQIITHNFSTLG